MKRSRFSGAVLAATVLVFLGTTGYAQRGMGNAMGVVREGADVQTVRLRGEVIGVITGPCEKTTGWSKIGTHLILMTEQGQERNVHLGPAHMVQDVVEAASIGKQVTVRSFRTERMAENHYAAITVSFDGKTIRLRDETLRPLWAGPGRATGYRPAAQGALNYAGGGRCFLMQRCRYPDCPCPDVCCRKCFGGRGAGGWRRWGQQSGGGRFGMCRRAWR